MCTASGGVNVAMYHKISTNLYLCSRDEFRILDYICLRKARQKNPVCSSTRCTTVIHICSFFLTGHSFVFCDMIDVVKT